MTVATLRSRPGSTLQTAFDHLRDVGLRLSAARRLVLEALCAADGPMSAEQIAGGIGGRVPCSDLASVYRNLEVLEQTGIVRHVHLGHGPGLYALTTGGDREYLTCERCGDFRALVPAELDGVRGLIRERFGYEACFVHFPIVGLCRSCRSDTGALSAPGSAPAPT
ncbi:Fur family transcriptional regulator [Capillimicrobium parvum]|uniref:Peroxide operon regulator n=1 Tax=Capillimicrobium parvum TaxID=2884022 RepID=A0A9E7BYN9_9ACTN|nr:transcriptional repressor [Capillimicrobium parvum]UGS34561.1 Peroxide operon regulator [Capillimicrobium parvum]